jgi:hypothetical protein
LRGWFGVIRFFRLVSLAVWIAYAFSLAYRLDAIENQDREAYQQDFADIKTNIDALSKTVSRSVYAQADGFPGCRISFFRNDRVWPVAVCLSHVR